MENIGRFALLAAYTAQHGANGILEIYPDTLKGLMRIKHYTDLKAMSVFKNVHFSDTNGIGKSIVTWKNWNKYQNDSTVAERQRSRRLETEPITPLKKKRIDAFNIYGDWVLKEYLDLKPGDPSEGEKMAVSAAYRRFGRAIRDILAFCKGNPEMAKKGTDAVSDRLTAMGIETFTLDAIARWMPDWVKNPEGFNAETKRTRPIQAH